MKNLLLLGGSRFLIPVIKEAHSLGCYVITCDFLPDNIAHKHSNEYHNVSIIDKQSVLQLAKKLRVDGVMSFATDPGVTTAGYVCEQLDLPTCPYKSIDILQNKAKFRKFLTEHGFNVPMAKGYTDVETALKDTYLFRWPVIVKPVDAAGSKGVTRVDNPSELKTRIEYAQSFSNSNEFIIEEFIEKIGYSSDSDCFSIDGKLAFVSFSNQRFDIDAQNPFTPSAYSWPSSMAETHQNQLISELQRLLTLLNMGTSLYNVEARVGIDGKAYIMEVSPRGGGNRLSEMLYYATGVNLIRNAVKAAIGDSDLDVVQKPYNGNWAEYILHSNIDGYYETIDIDESIRPYVRELDLWIEKGDSVEKFSGANKAIGTLVLNFKNQTQLAYNMERINDLVHVRTKK